MAINCANVAAIIHADMCDDPRNGYSWDPRYGGDHPDGVKHLTIDGRDYSYKLGSYDCSSSVCVAWQQALRYTPYEGALDGATYTGNMRSVFEGSGLFYSSREYAKRGDVYLNDVHHTAMCQDGGSDGVYGYDCLSEFSINENGGTYGGKVCDQTGRESRVHAFYNYSRGWNDTLHYNGKADGPGSETPSATPSDLPMPRYRSAIMRNGAKKWLGWCEGLWCVDGCGDDFSGIEGEPIVDIEFADGSLGPGGWFKKHMKDGKLVALTAYYKTPNPGSTGYYCVKYRVHWMGAKPAWGKWELDNNDDYAGNMRDAIDMVQATIERD